MMLENAYVKKVNKHKKINYYLLWIKNDPINEILKLNWIKNMKGIRKKFKKFILNNKKQSNINVNNQNKTQYVTNRSIH